MLGKEDFLKAVNHMPIVSIDLLVTDGFGHYLLGRRTNSPAQHSWFVPGGRIFKGETMERAFRRITETELGKRYELEKARPRGVFEHFYEDNFAQVPSISTHYVVLAHEVLEPVEAAPAGREQHSDYLWLTPEQIRAMPEVHPYTKAYFLP